MIKSFKQILVRVRGIIFSGSATWDEIVQENKSAKRIEKKYVYPLIFICIALTFIFKTFYAAEKALEVGLLNTIITAIALFGGYFISKIVCFEYLKKYKSELASRNSSDTIVAYSFTIIFIVEVLVTIIPSLFFLRVLSIFTGYIVWEGCRAVWKLNEDELGNVVLFFTIIIFFVPVIINKLIHFLLPNA